ncbi:MAG TPA: histidinol-phosphatase HisJ family protein [Firmicutes bacterium]|nr:histidinol-phosphatase HisJ family protein [Bacillota bacterium]
MRREVIDYHMHLERGPLTLEWLKKFWERAEMRGVQEIAITEHAHRFQEFYPVYSHLVSGADAYPYMEKWMAEEFKLHIGDYHALIQEAQGQGIPVKFGIEADYFLGKDELIGTLLQQYPFDFVLGSVHVLEKWGFDYSPDHGWEGRDLNAVYAQYIAVLTQAAKSGLFDCLAHLDVIKVFGHRAGRDYHQEWTGLFEAMAAHGLAMEISTAGLRKPVGEVYPAPSLIALGAQHRIPITIASDAHEPEDVGFQWEVAVGLAKAHGYTTVNVYSQRRPKELPI